MAVACASRHSCFPAHHGVTQQLIHRPRLHVIRGEIAVLGIPLQQPLALHKAANALGDGVGQWCEFLAGRRLHPAKPGGGSVGAVEIDATQKQHGEMDIQVQRTAETLDQSYSTGAGRFVRLPCLFDQMRSDGAVDNAQHLAHDRRSAGEQKP